MAREAGMQRGDVGRGRFPKAADRGGRFAQAPAPRAMTLLTLLGYAVVEPDIPIIGPAGRMICGFNLPGFQPTVPSRIQ